MVLRAIVFLLLFTPSAFGQEWAEQNSDGLTKFHRAICQGKLEVVRNYLSQGAPIFLRDTGGGNALHSAACSGSIKLLELIISYSPDFSARTNGGWTPLMFAIVSSTTNPDFVKILLDHGCVISKRELQKIDKYVIPMLETKSYRKEYEAKRALVLKYSKVKPK